jgi:DNA-binding NtrC family response regulator
VQESTRRRLKDPSLHGDSPPPSLPQNGYEFGGMLSKTAEMHRLFEIIRMVAPTEMTVLIEGETGTGRNWLPALSITIAIVASDRL